MEETLFSLPFIFLLAPIFGGCQLRCGPLTLPPAYLFHSFFAALPT